MKKKIILALAVSIIIGLASKTVFAFATQGGGGIVAVMIAALDADNKSEKKDSMKTPTTLQGEFAALNSLPEDVKLVELSAGGSVGLKTLLK